MSVVKRVFDSYRKIGKSIFFLILAETCLQLINAAFFFILLIYLDKSGYADHEAAGFVSYRFLGVVLVALPVGIYARGRKLLHLFYAAAIMVPLLSLAILYGIEIKNVYVINISMFFWGVFFNFIAVIVNPFIIRNCPDEAKSEAFALSYASGSFANILCGLLTWALTSASGFSFSESQVLLVIIGISLLAIPCLSFVNRNENIDSPAQTESVLTDYDWKLIVKALFPTFIIAVGAGFTIPFVSLFFYTVHHVDTDMFAAIGAITAILVTVLALLVPKTIRRLGFRKAITGTQTIAVILLILFSTTEWYSGWKGAVYMATIFYILRQPLMNMTAPMTTELILNYVGTKNREIISALTSAIWSGSWYFSSIIFKWLREAGQPYVNIFLITGGMYAIGVYWYHRLIVEYEERPSSM